MSDIPKDPDKRDEYIQSILEENIRLENTRKALIEEFRNNIPEEWTPQDLRNKVRDLLAHAYSTLGSMLQDPDVKDTVRFQVAKYVFDIGIGQIQITDDNDPNKEFNDLIKQLIDDKEKKGVDQKPAEQYTKPLPE